MVVKPLYYNSPPNIVDPTFYLGFHPLPTPKARFCAKAQIRCYNKWKNSSYIIAHLVNNIPTLTHYS